MDLRCKMRHQWNQKVDVDGEIVEIGPAGAALNVPEEAAKTLLQNKLAWRKLEEGEDPNEMPPPDSDAPDYGETERVPTIVEPTSKKTQSLRPSDEAPTITVREAARTEPEKTPAEKDPARQRMQGKKTPK